MRRVLAIALLLAFASPLVLPLFAATADPQASLPACCRRHGVHHCDMATIRGMDEAPSLQTPPCPLYPATLTLPNLAAASLAAPPVPSAEPMRNLASVPTALRRAQAVRLTANLKRGPPVFFA
jgi:hypothetical protein